MKLENAKRAGMIKLTNMAVPLVVLCAATTLYLFYEVKDLRYMVYAFIGLVVYFIVMSVFRFNYIVFYAGPDKIQIRFKTLTPFNSANNSVQIKSENFRKYEIKTQLGGLRKTLYLYQESPSGLAKYPAIGFSALTKTEIASIAKAFDLILALNNQQKS